MIKKPLKEIHFISHLQVKILAYVWMTSHERVILTQFYLDDFVYLDSLVYLGEVSSVFILRFAAFTLICDNPLN